MHGLCQIDVSQINSLFANVEYELAISFADQISGRVTSSSKRTFNVQSHIQIVKKTQKPLNRSSCIHKKNHVEYEFLLSFESNIALPVDTDTVENIQKLI